MLRYKFSLSIFLILLLFYSLVSCKTEDYSVALDYDQYTLENGLNVILHIDHSNPLVALTVMYHVGSGREEFGKTGLAHLLEHLMFQGSENVASNTYLQKISNMGGLCNGSTNSDGTIFFEVVPRDALEKVLWMESDRMGYLVNMLNQKGIDKEVNIVSNEKRQSYDTKPYGQTPIITAKEMFPKGHPYSWPTIGKISDLNQITLEDVRSFYSDFYVPNNATLVVAGDFDKKLVKSLIKKYFNDIKPGKEVKRLPVQPLILDKTRKIAFEDPYATFSELHINYPSVEDYNNDSYSMEMLAAIFANSKNSPLYKVLVDEKKLASSVGAYNISGELAGYFKIVVRAYKDVNLDDVYLAVEEAFKRFEENEIDEHELQKFKVMKEINFYNQLSKIQYKSVMLAKGNVLAQDPNILSKNLKKFQAVTKNNIITSYNKYLKNRPHFVLSIIPKGDGSLSSVTESLLVEIEKEQEIKGEFILDNHVSCHYDSIKTKSSFDRSIEPSFLKNTPTIITPVIWTDSLENGISLLGITQKKLPIIKANLRIKGGMLLDPANKPGISYLNARLMNEGTAFKTPEELENLLDLLGAGVVVSADREGTDISISCLTKNFKRVIKLVEEMVLYPRFDEEAFIKIKANLKSHLSNLSNDPKEITNLITFKALFGEDSKISQRPCGTIESIDSITLKDIKDYYSTCLSPSLASFNVAGDIDKKECRRILVSLEKKWVKKDITVVNPIKKEYRNDKNIILVNYPNLSQTRIVISKKLILRNNPDYYPCFIANYALGSGSQGILFDILRLQKGLTYGAYSKLYSGEYYSFFSAYSNVQANYTKTALETLTDIITSYGDNYNDMMLNKTKQSLLKAKAFSFETLDDLLNILNNIISYDLPFDYIKKEEEIIKHITLKEIKEIIKNNFNIEEMIYIIVGDLDKIGLSQNSGQCRATK